MTNSAIEITNLLYGYAELIDSGNFPEVENLFRNARMKLLGFDELQDNSVTVAMLKRVVICYPCGTPRTQHVITNPIIEIDETAGKATCRSYCTVLQATEEVPLQVIAAGRYNDRFERIDNKWWFVYRDYTSSYMQGNICGHLQLD